MLHDYLEKPIRNKLNILYVIHTRNSVTSRELSEILHLSMAGITLLITEINAEIINHAEIVNAMSNLSIHYKKDNNLTSLVHIICKNSNILMCMKFYITNKRNRAFSDFYEQYFISTANAYRIRQSCKEYLKSIDLDIDQNKICGEEYRIRFLIALLYYKYGVNCCDINEHDISLIRRYVLSTNKLIDMDYLQRMQNEYNYFEYLFILAWKRKEYDVPIPQNNHFEKLKEIFIYDKMKTTIKRKLEPSLGIRFSENDFDYLYLVYCCTNSCLFAEQWTQEEILKVHELVYSDPLFQNLMEYVKDMLGEEIQASHPIRTTFIYFYKKTLQGLCCLIPDEHFYMDSHKNRSTQLLYQALSDIIGRWKTENGLNNAIDRTHIYYLTLQIEFILRQRAAKVAMYVISDQNAELEVMQLTMEYFFSSRCSEIKPLLVNVQDVSFLYSQKNCVIVLEKKFENLVRSHMKENGNNRIIPITVEMGKRELQAIDNAICEYEEVIFSQFLNSMISPSDC
ncbi:MAG: helix-turn-helix domain-containing protein [Clostridium sp.]|nr:helix-turn-helix domain-containing protein [Clostridium sp.]